MKRVYLWKPGTGQLHLPTVRAAAAALARFAVDDERGRDVGDPIHEWVTEGRRTQWERAHAAGHAWAQGTPYSSCGDLAHWMLMCLGARDELVINRGDDGGVVDWKPGPNITRLVGSRWYQTDGVPEPGDILHVASPHHVAVLLEHVSDDQWVTADYGQPYGERRVCPVRRTASGLVVRGRILQGFVSMARVVGEGGLVESGIVPDGFVGGVADDNPYPEDLRVPVGG